MNTKYIKDMENISYSFQGALPLHRFSQWYSISIYIFQFLFIKQRSIIKIIIFLYVSNKCIFTLLGKTKYLQFFMEMVEVNRR